mmetsp:Transcript_4974/g.14124  ORF Transcript_4974/g.14124 Transcript_4974/m.14124 type:complete len:327 (-) Transcript_4974:762-1742(-)
MRNLILLATLLSLRTDVSLSFAPETSSLLTTCTPRSKTLCLKDSLSDTTGGPSSASAVSEHDIDQLVKLCYASSLSYLPIASIASSPYAAIAQSLRPIVQVVEPTTESGATIFECTAEGDDTIIVACRGSATPKNFVTNLRFQLKPLPRKLLKDATEEDARAHEGFQEAAEGLWERLEPNLMGGSIGRNKTIIFTGHSLGAGTSEMTALHASASSIGGADISQITTFGGPCIGDASFVRHVNYGALANTDIKHIVHDYDPILYNNGPLWERLGFERSGSTLQCDPHEARILTQNDPNGSMSGPRIPPFNIIDHCKYLGVFVGPRLN